MYSSNQHGQSYNSLLMRAAGRGPAIVVVRDKQGHVFGAFASAPLQKSGQFYGAVLSPSTQVCMCVVSWLVPALRCTDDMRSGSQICVWN